MTKTKLLTLARYAEYESLESFIQHLKDDEREQFTADDLCVLNFKLQLSTHQIRVALEKNGLNLQKRLFEKRIRGINTPNNDRWYGPGSARTFGGAGIDYTTGRATIKNKTA